MADHDFRSWKLSLKFKLKNAVEKFLYESIKFNPSAFMTLTGGKKFQIKAEIPNHPGFLSLEMEADHIMTNFDTDQYGLRFNARDWYERIKDPIFVNPFCSMSIQKFSGSTDVHCLFGEDDRLIKLGKAEFVQRDQVEVADPEFYLRMSMRADKFHQVMHTFLIGHDDGPMAFQIGLNLGTVMLIAPDIIICFLAERKGMTFAHGDNLDRMTLEVQWDRDLFAMLLSAATGCNKVEVIFSRNLVNQQKFYQLRFLHSGFSNCLSYQEEGEEVSHNGF